MSPDVVHSSVNNICKRTLGVVRDRFTEDVVAVPTTPELPPSAGKCEDFSCVIQPLLHPFVPRRDRWERIEILRLELFDDFLLDLRLVRQRTWPSPVITTVTDLL